MQRSTLQVHQYKGVFKSTKKQAPTPATKTAAVYKARKQFESGVRQQCTSVVPPKGATVEQIAALMKKKYGTDPKKVKGYVAWLAAKKNGYLVKE